MFKRLPEDLNVTRSLYFLGLISAVLFSTQIAKGQGPSSTPDRIVIRRCVTSYQRSSMLGSATHGVLQDCLVKLGDHVKANQVLGRLFDKDVRAEAELFKAKCDSDLAIRLSEAKHAESLGKLKASKALRLRNMLSNEDYMLDQLDATTCELELEGAKFDATLNEIRYRHALAVAKAREIVSPHDGIIEAVYRGQNETVSPTEPAFHVIDLDRVKVTGEVDVSNAWRVHAGQKIIVVPEIEGADLPIEKETFAGRVVFLDRIIDQKNQTCRVIAEVANPKEMLRAGLEVRMEIITKGDLAQNLPLTPAVLPRPTPPLEGVAANSRTEGADKPDQAETGERR